MKQYFYLAYGSNLDFTQMRLRCPGSTYLGSGFLKGELSFKGQSNNAHCTVDLNKKRKSFPVGIFLITEQDLRNLDRYEGYPRYYHKEMITPRRVTLTQWYYKDVKLKDAIIYVMNDNFNYGLPSAGYTLTVNRGYSCCGFNKKFLQEAYDLSKREYLKLCKRN